MSTYEDDLKTNFNILRQQYKSVFTTPKDNMKMKSST